MNTEVAQAGGQKTSNIHILIFVGQHGNCGVGQAGAKVTLSWTCLGVNHSLTKATDANGYVDFNEWCSDPGTVLSISARYSTHWYTDCGFTPPGSDTQYNICLTDNSPC